MTSVFENVYTRTEKVAQSMYIQQYLRNPRTKLMALIYAVILVVMVALFFMQQNAVWGVIFGGLCVVYLVVANVHSCRSTAKKILKRDRERYGESPAEITTMVTPLGITVRGKQGYDGKIAYEELSCVMQTKRFILLYLKARTVHALPVDAFTRGTAEECVNFIKSKGVKVK